MTCQFFSIRALLSEAQRKRDGARIGAVTVFDAALEQKYEKMKLCAVL